MFFPRLFPLSLLVDLFLFINAYLISQFILLLAKNEDITFFDYKEALISVLMVLVGLSLSRVSKRLPNHLSDLKKVSIKLLLILFSVELLKLGLPPISLTESLTLGICSLFFWLGYRIIVLSTKNGFLSAEGSLRNGVFPRILLFGAGEAGQDYLINQKKKGHVQFIHGILDDDLSKKGKNLEGIPILGSFKEGLPHIESLNINEIIICIEKISASSLGEIIDKVNLKRIKIKIIPALKEKLNPQKQINETRNIYAEDLLGRTPIVLNNELIKKNFSGKKILITGAGGSIGSEICHQLLSYPIKELVCVSRSEFSLYQLEEKLSEENTSSIPIYYLLGNVRDAYFLDDLFRGLTPDIVFHAAAHKHVPYMEAQEKEAIKNNVIGTENVLKACKKYSVQQFILISTDKAVNPSNVMGASKKLAEILSESYFQQHGLNTAIVRFGNVLGSKGSVVPLFKKQILKGGPITVTHPEVVRYFMTIPEAALLVINCSALARGGEKFILDMGHPIRIDDLVKKLIRIYGFKPQKDIAIEYTGLRTGEKLIEELTTHNESVEKTINQKIFVSKSDHLIAKESLNKLAELKARLHDLSRKEVRDYLKKIIPEFVDSNKE